MSSSSFKLRSSSDHSQTICVQWVRGDVTVQCGKAWRLLLPVQPGKLRELLRIC